METNLATSPHCHVESHLTSSTLGTFIDKAKALKRTHFAYTDSGGLSSALKAYSMCKKKGLKFIAGLEFYFKDPQCPFVSGTPADRCKYFTASIYCKDQAAYQALCKLVSKPDFAKIQMYEESQQLWTWKDLEHMSKFNVSLVLSGPHCMVGKPMLAGHADIGQNVFLKLKEIFKEDLWVALLAEPWTKKWSNVVEIKYTDGTKESLMSDTILATNRSRRIKAADLSKKSGHTTVKSKTVGLAYTEINKDIDSIRSHSGFLPLPGGDATLKVNKFLMALANKHDNFVMVSDYAYYASKDDKIVQTMKLEGNNKLQPNLYMKDFVEMGRYLVDVLGIDELQASVYLNNNASWAKDFDNFSLKYEMKLVNSDEDPYQKAMGLIRKNGRMQWDNPVWMDRLKEEFNVLAKNPVKNFLPYFFPIIGVNEFYKKNNKLVGVARGSAGGSLLCYLMGVTNLNPMKYNLSFSRFMSLDRIKNGDWPDVDSDYSDKTLLFDKDGVPGYLNQTYGAGMAQVGTKSTIRLKSAIKDTNRYFNGSVEPEIEVFTKGLPQPPQGVTDAKFVFGYEDDEGNHIPGLIEQSEDLQKYIEKRPDEWAIVSKAMGLTRSQSVHACAVLLSSIPLDDIIPLREGHITQYEAKETETAGLIKYDFLGVDQVLDIEVCLKLLNKRNGDDFEIGYFMHNGQKLNIWDLPEDLDVHKSIWGGETATIFQLHTPTMIPVVKEILPQSVEDISTILALNRPGPIDYIDENTGRNMVQEYICRRKGESEPDFPELAKLIPETYGVIVFQEQQLKIAKEVGGMAPDQAENLRRLFAKKKKVEALEMKPIFMKTAVDKLGKEKAEKLWAMMETFARYSFNCIGEDQKILTKTGHYTIKEISDNPRLYDVACIDICNSNLTYEKPSFGAEKGTKEVWTVELNDGTIIEATPDHRFWSEGSWITLKDIVEQELPFCVVKTD
jgi:DNA polymerase III alpha subunit